jgi:hypothetical protein
MDRHQVEERIGWMRSHLHDTDARLVRLGIEVREGTLVDADEMARRLVALDKRVEVRQDEIAIWRAYLFPPRSRIGRALLYVGGVLSRWGRAVG